MGTLLTAIIISLIVFSILIILNTVLAYGVYLYSGGFEWDKMLEFLKRRVAVYVLIWFVFSGMNILIFWLTETFGYVINLGALGTMTGIISILSALIVALLVQKIIGKFKKLGIAIGENNK